MQPTADPGTYFFGFGSGQDYENSAQVIGFAGSGGLGLPDRDYYLNDDAKSKEAREHYLAFVQQLFELLGDKDAAQESAAVMRVETPSIWISLLLSWPPLILSCIFLLSGVVPEVVQPGTS